MQSILWIERSAAVVSCILVAIAAATGLAERPGRGEGVALNERQSTSLSVLLVTARVPSRIIRLSALGEALVQRGHDVTLCTTEVAGDDLPMRMAKRAGMRFLSAGLSYLSTLQAERDDYKSIQNMPMHNLLYTEIPKIRANAGSIGRTLASKLATRAWDIVVADESIAVSSACLCLKWNIPVLVFRNTLEKDLDNPPWTFPVAGSGYTDDLTFAQRATLVVRRNVVRLVKWMFKTAELDALEEFDCIGEHFHRLYYTNEGFFPQISQVAIGLEYSRPVVPGMHYVGPFVFNSTEDLPPALDIWLRNKANGSVIYITMGAQGARPSKEMGRALVDGILPTNYSVLWSLKESDRDIIANFSLSKDLFNIQHWVPQQSVLKHPAIKIAISHGGMGGVSEALFNAVPLIVIPMTFDQFDSAARVQHAGAGVYLDKTTLTSDKVQRAIERVTSPKYKEVAEKLQKIFHQAGGVERAADLVEFYKEVGYEHLTPAPLKYEWSWVQYHSVDVYAFLLGVVLATLLVGYKVCTYCCRRGGSKLKTN